MTPPFFLHSLPSLIRNHLNLPFGTQGRSRRLNEAYFLQTRSGGYTEMFVPGSPTGSFSVSRLLFVKESMGWGRGREESNIEKEMEIRRRETLRGGPVTSPPTKQKKSRALQPSPQILPIKTSSKPSGNLGVLSMTHLFSFLGPHDKPYSSPNSVLVHLASLCSGRDSQVKKSTCQEDTGLILGSGRSTSRGNVNSRILVWKIPRTEELGRL